MKARYFTAFALLSTALLAILVSGEYRFPWYPGTRMQYGQRGVHDNGFPGHTPGWLAVDLVSDGDTGAGHAPNLLLASAAGTISYKCEPDRRQGERTTAVRIGNLMYTHLLNSADLYEGRSVFQHEVLGQLESGTFNETCGYADQQDDHFHVHLGFPDTGTITFEDWTLNMASGVWQRGSETRGIGGWFEAGGTFVDVPTNHWAFDYIEALYQAQ